MSRDWASVEHLQLEHDRLEKLEVSLRAHLSRTISRAEKAERMYAEQKGHAVAWESDCAEQHIRAEYAEDRIKMALRYHQPVHEYCAACGVYYPCDTALALDPVR